MHLFEYQEKIYPQSKRDELYCEGVSLREIAEQVGTPTYVYSYGTLARHYRVFDDALSQASSGQHLICYSMKANSNLAVLRSLVALGAGVDTVSAGEIHRALAAGAAPDKIVFSGVGKRDEDMAFALHHDILCFNVESEAELDALERVTAAVFPATGKKARVALRINPDVDAQTHPYISTGLKKNKFGIPMSRARAAFAAGQQKKHLEVIGLDCHIGSQLTKTTPFEDAVNRLGELARDLQKSGIALRHLDLGGGLGIPYRDEQPPSPLEYGQAIAAAMAPLADLGLSLICEPGRVIVGNAGVLLTRTIYLKEGEEKHFVIVDAAMNDLIRPAFYDAYHAIWPVEKGGAPEEPFTADVVGPICETGDFLARDRSLGFRPRAGDLLAVMSAGAYGFTMSSNYNSRPRAAEVLVRGNEWAVVRQRETMTDLLRGEEIPAFVK